MFEPVHGSAPPLAGRNVANPMGAILSAALMLEDLGLREEAQAIEAAVQQAVTARQGTADIGGVLGTRETGDYITGAIRGGKQSHKNTDERNHEDTKSTKARTNS